MYPTINDKSWNCNEEISKIDVLEQDYTNLKSDSMTLRAVEQSLVNVFAGYFPEFEAKQTDWI
eukprot:5461468-Amphidinium_carterae.1